MGCCMSSSPVEKSQEHSNGQSAQWSSMNGDAAFPIVREHNSQTESIGRTDRGDIGTNTELHSEALSIGSTGPPDPDEFTSQTDKWSVLNDEMHGSGRNDSIAGTQPDLDDVSISSDPHQHWSPA